ncbi:MAG: amino acid adenylation domain-containing protein [Acidimicrobiales bacterium]
MSQSVRLEPRRSLTTSQELIWASQRLHPDAPLQNMANVSRISGSLDPQRFVRAVDEVVRGSDALRTVVREVDGVPHPAVLETPPMLTEVIALSEADLDSWMDERISVPLDLARTAYDSVLFNHGDDVWSWWFDVHHLATDAASSALIFSAVVAAYHERWDPPEAYAAYADLLVLESTSSRTEKATAHWERISESLPDVSTTFYEPDRGPTTCADRVWLPADEHRHSRLDALLDDRFRLLSPDLSLTAALATAVAVYLHRLGNETIVIGLPVHHRSSKRARTVIGPLVEMFPLEVQVAPEDTFASVQSVVSRSIFELLRHALPGTSPRQSFDVVLNVHGATFGQFGDMPTRTRWIHPGHIDSHHRMRVQALDYDGLGELEICLDLSHRSTEAEHRSLAGRHFARVVDTMLADPDAGVGSFSLIDEAEALLLAAVASPSSGTPLDLSVPQLIQQRLEAHRDRPAMRERSRRLDGAGVDELIGATSERLRVAGIGPGDLVALEMPLGIDVVAAVHAVLRVGAAFVPIDPAYPDDRREHIRTDSGASLTLRSLDELPEADGGSAADAEIDPDDLAYVMYTSGSTGLPKGVPITHRGLSEYLGFAHNRYIDSGPIVMPLFTSLSFDLTITTLFLPFLAGGLMTVHPEGGLAALREIVDEREATLLKATPSHLELLMRMIDEAHPLRGLVVGGEAFTSDLAERLLDVLAPGAALHNEYGPTEAVVGCMHHRYDPSSDAGPHVPIGSAAPGVGLRVIDQHDHPVPIGVSGELLISRPGLTTGYLDRPELSGERFIAAGDIDDSRWYRSGDLVRMSDVDTLVYLGRIDQQLKVGGIRLEPGEIEAIATSTPGVRRAVAGLWSPDARHQVARCKRCGLGNDVPGIAVDGDGICSACHEYDVVAPQAAGWFRTELDLRRELDDARARSGGDYDVLHLLSGGKDSTYALHRLVGMGARVLAITLDNGFIAEVAKDNVRRATERLGVDHEFVTVDSMNEIFRDSLDRYSNVCNGCYKAIYTVALERATRLSIPAIVTGLSRGQFFETRLVPGMFAADRFDADAIDAAVVEARRVYHRTPDAVLETMDTSFIDDDLFDRISFIDIYRYLDVELAEMYRALESTGIWQRPPDSGRSTNCLINAAGIYVHTVEQGHHNYAMPYSWDVRLGHKTRAEALEELDDPMGPDELAAITSMLAEVGYEPHRHELLTLWLESDPEVDIDVSAVRDALTAGLPEHAWPRAIELTDSIPLSPNGKVDHARLPAPSSRRIDSSGTGRAPATETEKIIARVWTAVLGVVDVRATDDFFALGGTSLHALEMVVRLSDDVERTIPEALAFRTRTVADLASAIDDLDNRGDAPAVLPDLTADERPLSPGEEALLYEWRRDPADRRYNVARLYRVKGDIDRARFDSAVRAVVENQPTLRTSYGRDRRELAINNAVTFGRIVADVASLAALADRLNEQPFDLVTGPLLTCHHLESGSSDDAGVSGILLRAHHIVSDAGSLDVLWQQIDRVYQGLDLEPLTATYAEHGAFLGSKSHDLAAAWPVAAGEEIGELALRPDREEPDGYVHLASHIDADAIRHGPGRTLFATALTALAAAMRAYHDADRFEIAVTSSVRDHPSIADVVGYFLNPLPLLVDVRSGDTGVTLADRIGDTLATALEHRAVPFGTLVKDARARGVAVPRSRVMLAVEDLAPASLDGHAVGHEILASGVAVNDLTFFVQVRGSLVELGVEYRGRTVSRERASELLSVFDRALSTLVNEPEHAVTTAAPRIAPLRGGKLSVDAPFAPDRIRERIQQTPGGPAVRCGDESITYGELDDRARALAGHLRAIGVAPGDRVAIVVPRSVELPVAIVATWMLGASYVPIDVSQPASRVAELVSAADVVAAVSSTEGHAGLGEVVTVSADRPDSAVLPVAVEHATAGADEAYLIFTSGSTGRPKGVPISHENLAASLAARFEFYADPVERYLLVSSAGFDSSVAGIFWALADGGELVLPTEDEVHDVDALLELVERTRPTHTLCVPSLYNALLARFEAPLPGLRIIIVAGESCPRELVERHRRVGATADLVNEYGPTEATVWATAHVCASADGSVVVPIGAPIAGVTAHVLDERGAEVPIDVTGELVLAGQSVGAGYLGEEPSSAFLEIAGERAYRTGDIVVRRRSGELDFVGRIDDQISVGGVRVEPAEIEQAASGFPGVTTAASTVVGRELLLWFEASGTIEVDTDQLRSTLSRRLAPTHLPSRVIEVDEIPRNHNGKVDRSLLGTLPRFGPSLTPPPIPVQVADPATKRMIGVWEHAFEGERIGPDTDFFAAGGDSLRAVELVAALEEVFGGRIGIGELIDAPTPRRLSSRLQQSAAGHAKTASPLVETLRSTGSGPPLVVLPPGGGNLLRYAALVSALPPELAILGIRLPGADARSEIADTIAEQSQVMLDAMDTIHPGGPYRLLGWSTGGLIAWEMARLLEARGDTVDLVALVDTVMGGLHVDPPQSPLEKYRSLLGDSGPEAVVREAGQRALERTAFSVARARYRHARRRGQTPSLEDAERQLGPVVRRAALGYAPGPLDTDVVYYAASESDDALTVDPWTRLHGERLAVVELDGVHFLPDERCIVGPTRVHTLADDLQRRLARVSQRS